MNHWKKEILLLLIAIGSIVGLNGILVWAESNVEGGAITSFSEAIWYMVVTLTTVGYGDLYPVSTIGKIIGYIYVFSSIGLLGLFLGTITNRYQEMKEYKKTGFYGTDFEDHVILFGWNEFSRMVLEGIVHIPTMRVAVVTDKKDDVELIHNQYDDDKVFVLFSDFHNKELYDKLNAQSSKMVFLSLPEDSDSLMYAINFRRQCPDIEIIVSTSKSTLKETFESAGVTHVVSKHEIVSKLVASYIFEPDVAELNLDLLDSSKTEEDYDVMEFLVADGNPYIGRNGKDLFHDLKNDMDAVLMGIRKLIDGKRLLIKNPPTSTKLEKGDYVLVMANRPIRKRLEDSFGLREGLN